MKKLQEIPHINQVTHVYYAGKPIPFRICLRSTKWKTAYAAHGSDFQTVKSANVAILTSAIEAVTELCPYLEFWTLQTGGKAYGVEFYGQPGLEYHPPLKESSSRVIEPYASDIFYYAQVDMLAELSKGQRWNFCEIRPDVIIGYTPRSNGIGFPQALGLYLAMYSSEKGKGAEIVFPGADLVWKALHGDTSQDVLARFHIHASLNPDKVSQKAFNIADEAEISWKQIWPGICSYFGLKGVGPGSGTSQEPTGIDWIMSRKDSWGGWVKQNGLQEGVLETSSWDVVGMVFVYGMFDRQFDLSASEQAGFKENSSVVAGYHLAFDRMRKAKII